MTVRSHPVFSIVSGTRPNGCEIPLAGKVRFDIPFLPGALSELKRTQYGFPEIKTARPVLIMDVSNRLRLDGARCVVRLAVLKDGLGPAIVRDYALEDAAPSMQDDFRRAGYGEVPVRPSNAPAWQQAVRSVIEAGRRMRICL